MEKDRIESLVNRAQSGDLEAMEKLLEVAHTSVSYQCRKMMPSQEDAEDLTQEVLLAVYQKIDTLKETKVFWRWLNRVTATHCMNALSRNHVALQFAEDEDGHSVVDDLEVLDEHSIPDKALDNAETARMIDEIVSGLPEAQRMSTLLYYYDEMSVKEIAQIMNVPENTVKSRLNLARKAIKDKVLDYEKQGVKLYSVSVLPFLWYFLRTAAESQANTGAAAACASGVMAVGTVTGGAAATAGVTAVAGEAVVRIGVGKLIVLIIAGITALGGISFGTVHLLNQYCYPVPAVICQHEWLDANCIEPKTCSKCNSVEGEALGHKWIDATCYTAKNCDVCGRIEGEALGHNWVSANFQNPESCAACGETTGEVLTPGMESHNMDVINVVLGKGYNCITTSNKNKKLKTTGQIVFDNYERFESNETYEAMEGYEWMTISVDVAFSDDVAKAYGFNLFANNDDYYTPSTYSGDSGENTCDFVVSYRGVEYADCVAGFKNSSISNWVDGVSIWHVEWYWRIPVGYDGVTLVFYDSAIKPAIGEYVWDYADDNTLIFRLGDSISEDMSHTSKISQREARECVSIISPGRCGMINNSSTGFTFCITEAMDAPYDVKSVEILSAKSYGYSWEIYSADTADEIEQTLQNDGADTESFVEFLHEEYEELHILFTVVSPKEQLFESRDDGYGEHYIDLLITYRVHFANGEYVDLTYLDLWNQCSGGGWPLFPKHYEYS